MRRAKRTLVRSSLFVEFTLFDYQFLCCVAEYEDIDARRQVVHVYSEVPPTGYEPECLDFSAIEVDDLQHGVVLQRFELQVDEILRRVRVNGQFCCAYGLQ